MYGDVRLARGMAWSTRVVAHSRGHLLTAEKGDKQTKMAMTGSSTALLVTTSTHCLRLRDDRFWSVGTSICKEESCTAGAAWSCVRCCGLTLLVNG